MKGRYIVLSIIAAVFLLTGLLVLGAFKPKSTHAVQVRQMHSGERTGIRDTNNGPSPTEAGHPIGGTVAGADSEVQHYLRATESVRENIKQSQVPLDFFGRVIDENGEGIAAVKVHISYTRYDPLRPFDLFLGHGDVWTVSDAQGTFSVRGVKVYGFIVELAKDGYDVSASNFRSANLVDGKPVRTDAASPMIFHLRKKGVAEPLIYYEKSYRLARDGTPKQINLVTGHTNNLVADLKVQAWTDDQHKNKGFRYDFRVRIEVLNGGLVESQQEFDYTAPETGYSPSYEIDSPASLGDKWRDQPERIFLIRIRNGEMYGRVKFKMISGGDHFCWIEAWLNPSGSRNLEPDPKRTFPDLESYNRHLAAHPPAGHH